MAKVNWSDLEMEMVLYFYLTHDKNITKNGYKIKNFTNRLNFLSGNKRTTDSIYMRLQNYKYVDPDFHGKGLSGGATQCQIYWDKYINNFDKLRDKYNDFLRKTDNCESDIYIPTSIGIEKWTNLEMEICLYIYFNYDISKINRKNQMLRTITKKMNAITGNKRTVESIYMRLLNYEYIDPLSEGKGLSGGAVQCQIYWDKFFYNRIELEKIYQEFLGKTIESDISDFDRFNDKIEINKEEELSLEQKDAFIESLLNIRNPKFQQHFKDGLICEFDGQCVLCGIRLPNVLIASHIIPYSKCEKKHYMIDPNNGLLLCPTHDALFDKKLISFDASGRIIISHKIDEKMYDILGISDDYVLPQKYYNKTRKKYMEFHRNMFDNLEK